MDQRGTLYDAVVARLNDPGLALIVRRHVFDSAVSVLIRAARASFERPVVLNVPSLPSKELSRQLALELRRTALDMLEARPVGPESIAVANAALLASAAVERFVTGGPFSLVHATFCAVDASSDPAWIIDAMVRDLHG